MRRSLRPLTIISPSCSAFEAASPGRTIEPGERLEVVLQIAASAQRLAGVVGEHHEAASVAAAPGPLTGRTSRDRAHR
ncbi:MAG: hypothetical protein SYR96_17555 [Actinomycetota bacterium]|nr:hypothetical protein [Actinomycetota bacterium]